MDIILYLDKVVYVYPFLLFCFQFLFKSCYTFSNNLGTLAKEHFAASCEIPAAE